MLLAVRLASGPGAAQLLLSVRLLVPHWAAHTAQGPSRRRLLLLVRDTPSRHRLLLCLATGHSLSW
jgi:hypothetical protein